MYTHLSHDEILRSITWLIDYNLNKPEKRKTSKENFIAMTKSQPRNFHITNQKPDDHLIFSRKDILNIVNLDLNTSYQTKGNDLFIQNHGCPMGGFLSAIYANIKCAFDELKFIQTLGKKSDRIYGIRQMDDLILWISYDPNDHASYKEAIHIKNFILGKNNAYSGGLELEIQDPINLPNPEGTKLNKFSGTIITLETTPFRSTSNLSTKTMTIHLGWQKFPRFIPKNSYVPNHTKLGVISGSICRLAYQSGSSQEFINAIIENHEEMKICGYSTHEYLATLIKTTRRNHKWKEVTIQTYLSLKKYLDPNTAKKIFK